MPKIKKYQNCKNDVYQPDEKGYPQTVFSHSICLNILVLSPDSRDTGTGLFTIKKRRSGDIATCYCNPGKAAKELGWKAENSIKEMCEDSWRWQKNNPNGYED